MVRYEIKPAALGRFEVIRTRTFPSGGAPRVTSMGTFPTEDHAKVEIEFCESMEREIARSR